VRGREPVAALARLGLRVVDAQEPRDGLLLQPLAHVALGGAGALGQLTRSRIAAVGERVVEAEPAPEVDGGDLERGDRGHEQALDQRLGRAVPRRIAGTHLSLRCGGGGGGGGSAA
jgi:hypothetical protein